MSFKVVIVHDPLRVPDGFCEKINQLGAECTVKECKTEDERIEACWDADFILTGFRLFPFTRRVIERLERCRFMEAFGVGYTGVDIEAATERGIGILHNRPLCDDELSDHVMALILARSRWIVGLHSRVLMGKPVPSASFEAFRNMSILRGKVLGLIGLGRNGKATVPKAQGFGMKVIAYDPYVDKAAAEELNVQLVDLEQLLKESDYVSIHTHLTSETKHMIGLEEFKKMKPSASIINISRGAIIDEQALYTALSEGCIAGAGLDVTDPDPPETDSPLLKFENVILTGHNGGASAESGVNMWKLPLEQVSRVLRGEWPLWMVNPEVKEKYIAKWGNVREEIRP